MKGKYKMKNKSTKNDESSNLKDFVSGILMLLIPLILIYLLFKLA